MKCVPRFRILGPLAVSGALLLGATGAASATEFEVTVTNLTRGQQFTPILVTSHKAGVRLFELGSPATPQLKTLAEEGNVAPLTALLLGNPDVRDVVNSGGLLGPGNSGTQRVSTRGGFDNVSVAAMQIPTNDGFFAVNDAEGPNGQDSITVFSPAYDAATERNDETCASIPGRILSNAVGPAEAVPREAAKGMCISTPASMASATWTPRSATGAIPWQESRFAA